MFFAYGKMIYSITNTIGFYKIMHFSPYQFPELQHLDVTERKVLIGQIIAKKHLVGWVSGFITLGIITLAEGFQRAYRNYFDDGITVIVIISMILVSTLIASIIVCFVGLNTVLRHYVKKEINHPER
ncbi:MAG: hypothetical protein GY943_11945 [Chloroflexi bacterium]|nr:hypothetical protein [Chloroflexota bacterium]